MKVGIIVFPGSSCETDTIHPIAEIYGTKNVDYVWYQETKLDKYDLIVLPGGFSYGDYLRPGAIAKQAPVIEAVRAAAEAGRYILGISNGFQLLTEIDLLPGALLINQGINFICDDADVVVENNETTFTLLYSAGEQLRLPIAHGHGNYFCESEELAELEDNRRIVLRYAANGEKPNSTAGGNPNGSMANIAALTNPAGNVLGIMPHIDRALDKETGSDAGIRLFESILKSWGDKR